MQSKKRPATRTGASRAVATGTPTGARRATTRDDEARPRSGAAPSDRAQAAGAREAPVSIASTVIARLLADRPPLPESPLDDVIARLVPGSAPLLETLDAAPLEAPAIKAR